MTFRHRKALRSGGYAFCAPLRTGSRPPHLRSYNQRSCDHRPAACRASQAPGEVRTPDIRSSPGSQKAIGPRPVSAALPALMEAAVIGRFSHRGKLDWQDKRNPLSAPAHRQGCKPCADTPSAACSRTGTDFTGSASHDRESGIRKGLCLTGLSWCIKRNMLHVSWVAIRLL